MLVVVVFFCRIRDTLVFLFDLETKKLFPQHALYVHKRELYEDETIIHTSSFVLMQVNYLHISTAQFLAIHMMNYDPIVHVSRESYSWWLGTRRRPRPWARWPTSWPRTPRCWRPWCRRWTRRWRRSRAASTTRQSPTWPTSTPVSERHSGGNIE